MNNYILAIDLGGTSCKFGLFNTKDKLLSKWSISSKLNSKNKHLELFNNIILSIKNYFYENNIDLKCLKYIGIGVAGKLKNDYTISEILNLGINKNINLKNVFSKDFYNINVICDNDANVAALGEYSIGYGKNKNPFCHIIIGTGIGLGIIIDGKILKGYNNTAGEFGHLIVDKEFNLKCNCNEIGCLETVSSGNGIKNLYYLMNKNKNINNKTIDSKYIIEKAKSNNVFCQKVLNKSMDYLSKSIIELNKIINPELITIGGGVSNEGSIIIDYLNRLIEKNMKSNFINKPNIKISKLKNDCGIYGAYILAKQKFMNTEI